MKKNLVGWKEKKEICIYSWQFHIPLNSWQNTKIGNFPRLRNNYLGYHDKTQKLDGWNSINSFGHFLGDEMWGRYQSHGFSRDCSLWFSDTSFILHSLLTSFLCAWTRVWSSLLGIKTPVLFYEASPLWPNLTFYASLNTYFPSMATLTVKALIYKFW